MFFILFIIYILFINNFIIIYNENLLLSLNLILFLFIIYVLLNKNIKIYNFFKIFKNFYIFIILLKINIYINKILNFIYKKKKNLIKLYKIKKFLMKKNFYFILNEFFLKYKILISIQYLLYNKYFIKIIQNFNYLFYFLYYKFKIKDVILLY